MRFQRIGLKLADEAKHGLKPRHEAIMALTDKQTPMLELNQQQAIDYLMGRDVLLEQQPASKGEVIVSRHNSPLGLGKILPGKLKNSLPRELVKDRVC